MMRAFCHLYSNRFYNKLLNNCINSFSNTPKFRSSLVLLGVLVFPHHEKADPYHCNTAAVDDNF